MEAEVWVAYPDGNLETGLPGVEDKDLAVLISNKIKKLNVLEQSVKKSVEAAEKAKASAGFAKDNTVGFFNKKTVIENLQSSGVDLAEALICESEAQKKSFEFHNETAEFMKFLFKLGITSTANNRKVVRELEMRIKGASEEEISELARQELIAVVKQLKDQEDLLKKQEDISANVKIHQKMLTAHTKQLNEQKETNHFLCYQLELHQETNQNLETQLQEHSNIQRLLSEKLESQRDISQSHDGRIGKIEANVSKLHLKLKDLEENKKTLLNRFKTNEEHVNKVDILLVEQIENIEIQEKNLADQLNHMNDMQKEINQLKIALESKASNVILKIALGVAAASVVLTVVTNFM